MFTYVLTLQSVSTVTMSDIVGYGCKCFIFNYKKKLIVLIWLSLNFLSSKSQTILPSLSL